MSYEQNFVMLAESTLEWHCQVLYLNRESVAAVTHMLSSGIDFGNVLYRNISKNYQIFHKPVHNAGRN